MLFMWCKVEFSSSLLQFSVSISLEIISIYLTQETFLIIVNVFNIDNNEKYLLSIKSAYYNDLWRIMWHWNFSL